jgi:hypothetical protein
LTIKPGQPLVSLGETEPLTVLRHPAQQAMVTTIAKLIAWMRDCNTLQDCYDFQQCLFGYLYKTQERHQQCSRIVKRLTRGKTLPANAPEPPPTGDPEHLATWELELYVYERLIRQLRMVGDGFAWTCFGYDRRAIVTLSRNDPPGLSYGKPGLHAELAAIDELWKSQGHFALHHDSTNCLRIADLTEFTEDGYVFVEVKTSPRFKKEQVERAQAAVNAINRGGVLPSSVGDFRLVQLNEPYITNLKHLHDLLQLAKRNGCHGMKLTQGRALVSSYLPAMTARWGHDIDGGADALDATKQQAYKRAGIATDMHHIIGYSGDTASRSPIMAPWSIYPFTPIDCAALICDMLVFDTTVSADALVESLAGADLRGEVLLTLGDAKIEGTMPVIRAHWRNRAVTWHALGLNQLLYELAEPDALARGIREVLLMDEAPDYPTLIYANEAACWFSAPRKRAKRDSHSSR